ncbi:hypothetical protein C8T65DRAFT_254477 [Cerioporus squamosus]|nr:hypothetical protein C8T65DRAFT_254477 [Cerioporus squamosus]
MLTARSPLWKLWALLSRAYTAAAQSDGPSDARSLSAALQNINGMSSIFSLLPVLTGKTQNVKCIAARTFPGSLAVVGLGAGRVLSKLQLGIMLLSADLYRNLVGELSYPHQEYVNAFSPSLVHIPTGTPERHSSNVIVNHNLTEDYMVEAWFQTQGLPAKVELSQWNNLRVFCGLLVYLLAYAFETFLCVQNAATGAAIPLVVVQTVSGVCWIVAVCILQAARGQGKRFVYLNRLATAEYRCFQLITSGKHVRSALISTQLSNIRDYNLYDSKYDSKQLQFVGGAMVASGMIDVFATILVVGLNTWAYGWLAWQVLLLIIIKVIFSLEPIRRVPIVDVQPLVGDTLDQGPSPPVAASAPQGRRTRLPITVELSSEFSLVEVSVTQNVVRETATRARWCSRTPGLFIGQPYHLQRPMLSEKQTVSSAESIPQLPLLHVSQVSETRTPSSEKVDDPTMLPLPPSPLASKCASTTSSDSASTITPSPTSPKVITEVPRIIISPESPLVASPTSPTSPPGIVAIARSASTRSASTRAPTPPTKSPRRAATMPLRGPPPVSIVTRGGAPNASFPNRPRPVPSRSLSQTLVAPPQPAQNSEPKPKHQSPSLAVHGEPPIRYLALGRDGKLTLSETEPAKESNQALQREFLACLAEVVKANKVPSVEFLLAVEAMREGIRKTMSDNWYAFATADLSGYLRASYVNVLWRRFV